MSAETMRRVAVSVEHRQIDPVEAGMKAGAPDHGGCGNLCAVLGHCLAVTDALELADPANAGTLQLTGTGPDQRHAVTVHLAAELSPHRRAHGQQMVEHSADDQAHQQLPA
jgi:hypothetical protein